MARLSRLVVPGEAHLVRQAVVEGAQPFAQDVDCRAFLESLRRAATEKGVAVHGYVLLPDSWLMVCVPSTADALGKLMQAMSRWFVTDFNRRHARTGSLWNGRFTAGPLAAEHVLDAVVYVELAAVRRGLAYLPAEHPWSSAGHHVLGGRDPLLAGHQALWALGNTPFEREAAHRQVLERGLSGAVSHAIESQLLKGWGWASAQTLAEWAERGRRTTPLQRGRPKSVQSA
ncbi:transposase [Piscinibacter terrae]|uniref:Transposase n=1 Tax=Piscinibacter terrae TaxID=2496871 RepID=A0A3N7K654_9BURK|nr:transposase [Albitalea terrae]RQP26385.1 transposase [Albitalea terrae]